MAFWKRNMDYIPEFDEEMSEVMYDLYDDDAAQTATPEDARKRLRVIKHYVRATWGSKDINRKVQEFLRFMNVEPLWPSSVAANFEYVMHFLRTLHVCSGKDCVRKLLTKYRDTKPSSEDETPIPIFDDKSYLAYIK